MLLAITGCQINNMPAKTMLMGNLNEKPKQFILLGADSYEGDLSIALFQKGFKVKPFAITQNVTEFETPTKLVEYKEAGYRYALKLSIKDDYGRRCVFSGGHIVNVTMSVIDISTNETLAIIQQSGPNQECPPLTPVWTLLADELSKVWQLNSGS
jgi:hypothetical protein